MKTDILQDMKERVRQLQDDYRVLNGEVQQADYLARQVAGLKDAIRKIDEGEPVMLALYVEFQSQPDLLPVVQMPYLFKYLLQEQIDTKLAEIEELMRGL